jgi:ER degradation enhancer, mannosidase alpha-like 2
MKVKITSGFLLGIILIGAVTTSAQNFTTKQKEKEAARIRSAAHFAWNGYTHYAWGYDALRPITKQGANWYDVSFQMSSVDGFDTFTLMGLKEEAADCKRLILTKLNFNVNQEVQLFEINIRLLGGLLSAYELDGDPVFLNLAKDLGKRLLPAFNTETGMPYRYINLRTGKLRDSISNPAEIGTYLLEFGKLTQYTKDSAYYFAAKKATFAVFNRRSDNDLVGTTINVTTGEWKNRESQIGARIDSYYEYLFKAWKLFGDTDCYQAWQISNKAIKKHLLTETDNGSFFTRVDMNSGKEKRPLYGALDAFYAGILAYAGDIKTAQAVQKGNYYMWTHFNMEPEEFNFKTDTITDPSYPLRPENLESCFYLYRMTKNQNYLFMGQKMIEDILKNCKSKAGYAQVKDVRTLKLDDYMESFFLAETLKYAYLLFAPEKTLDLNKFVFNTEAHPLQIAK